MIDSSKSCHASQQEQALLEHRLGGVQVRSTVGTHSNPVHGCANESWTRFLNASVRHRRGVPDSPAV